LKVLLITPKMTGIGGVAPHVSKLRSLLLDSGHEVDVISVENVPHVPIKGLYNPSFTISSYFKSLCLRAGGRKYDVAHAHNFPSWPAASVSDSRIKVITVHGIFSSQHRALHGWAAGSIASRLEKRWASGADVLTCVSKSSLKYYAQFSKRAVYVPNAIDISSLPKESIRVAERQVVCIGRLSYEKGTDVLVDALDRVDSSITVLIIGSGRDELVREAVRKHPNVKYLGYQPHEIAMKYLKGSDALVLPSREEGLPTVLLEAMALRVPVIASEIEEITQITKNVVSVSHPSALAEAINSVVLGGSSPDVNGAYEEVKEYDWNNVYKKYIEVYEGRV